MDISRDFNIPSRQEHIEAWFDATEIEQATRDKLWSFIAVEIEDILTDFYDRIENSAFRPLVENANLDILKHKQINHWRKLFLYPVEDEYEARLKRMHAYHFEIGLQTGQYIVSYLFLLNAFQKSILRQSAGPKEAFQLMQAMNAIVAGDIARAVSAENIVEL